MNIPFEEALQKAKDARAGSHALAHLENLHSWEEFFAHENAPYWAYLYACDVINGRWPEGEEAIKKSPGFAYFYACDVLKSRWPEGEEAILTSLWAEEYTQLFIKTENEK